MQTLEPFEQFAQWHLARRETCKSQVCCPRSAEGRGCMCPVVTSLIAQRSQALIARAWIQELTVSYLDDAGLLMDTAARQAAPCQRICLASRIH